MRLRKPDREYTPLKEPENKTGIQSVTYEVTTITPIFGGGVEAGVPDEEMPIRATAIRGQLRYWWRFLASHRKENRITDHKILFEQERKIWGGMGEKGEDYASKIFIRVHDIENKQRELYDGNKAGYALFPAREEKKYNKPAKDLIKEGINFNLQITAPQDCWPEIENVLRWWMTFGGIGSRTRRGVGSVEIKELTNDKQDKFLDSITRQEAEKHQCKLTIGTEHFAYPISAWEKAVEYLQDFRQKAGIGRNPRSRVVPAGRSLWPEADSIRKILNTHSVSKIIQRKKYRRNEQVIENYQCNDHSPKHPAMISFPRAYFGLPIVFQFKDVDCGEPKETQLLPQNSERLASPLILTPYRNSNGEYVAYQVTDVLEFFSAWVLLEDEKDYADEDKGHKRLDQLINARKNTREFIPNPVQGNSIAKSSLDGLRESVLLSEIKPWDKRKLGLSAGEELDCIGVVKRLGGNPDQFTPLSRLAVDPWLRYLEHERISISDIKDVIGELSDPNLGLVSTVTGNDKTYDFFPYDGQLLYDFRIEAELKNLDRLGEDADQAAKDNIETAITHLNHLKDKITTLPFKELPKPTPYMAILAADGDRMGELLDSMSCIGDHQQISAILASFATRVPAIVRGFRGHCIYAGGDDVLALLPLDKAILCARELAADFTNTLAGIENIEKDKVPTLSVGLGISHFLTPMGKQLELARRAEQLAKSNNKPKGESKNALAILLQPRSGAEISFRERWDNKIPPAELLGKWIQAHNDNLLPRRFGYELREISLALSWCEGKPDYQSFIEKETSRILERKRKKDGTLVEDGLIAEICKRAAEIGLKRLADELIITRRIAEVYKLSGEPVPGEENHA